ncbi:MAG: LAGLIDADG family homing endonuclease, partial [Bacilli bacterium]
MAGYKNFQSDNFKYTRKSSRTTNHNPEFLNGVKTQDNITNSFEENVDKWIEFTQWMKFYPDLFYDLIKPNKGGMRLDLDQRVFLRCMSRFSSTYGVFPRGFGKCVSQDTMLFTNQGLKEIGEYFNYSDSRNEFYTAHNIKTLNKDGQLELSDKGVHNGFKDTKRIITEEGYELEGSLNHPILIMNRYGNLEYKKLEELKVGDYTAISKKNDIWGNNTKLNIDVEQFLNGLNNDSRWKVERNKCNIPKTIDEKLSLIIGYLLGDGTMTRNNVIRFTNKDEDIIYNFINYFEKELGIKVKKRTSIDYEICGMYIREAFRQMGLEYCNAYTKEIPKCILETSKQNVIKCLQGLFDTDGGLNNSGIEFTTASKKMSIQIQLLLLNLGIVSSRRKKYNKKFKTYSYNISIYSNNVDKFKELIGFSCKVKQDKLEKMCMVKRNPNKDIIPYQNKRVNAIHPVGEIRDKLYHVLKGNNQLTYRRCKELLNSQGLVNKNSIEYQTLQEIFNKQYFYSRVKSINDNKNYVCDLQMNDTHSFISNGMVSHNTMIELMSIYHTCIFFPDITTAMSAQTRENAASISEEKHNEIIRWFPLMKNEITKSSFSKDSVEVIFVSGGIYSVLANSQSTKGQRKRRMNIEESALLNNLLYKDALEPVVNVPRRTIGRRTAINPYELNGMINFVTTSGYRGSDEYVRIVNMLDEMAELKGKIVLGAGWELPCWYGRGETKSQILAKKEDPTTSSVSFARNYESKWVGASDGALVNIDKLLNLRKIPLASLIPEKGKEYFISADIARSESQSNNKSAFVVGAVTRNDNHTIKEVAINLIYIPPNGLNFFDQNIIVRRLDKQFNGKISVVDINGVGQGVSEELQKDCTDITTGTNYEAWATLNTGEKPMRDSAPEKIFGLKAQGIQTSVITNFIDFVESGRLKLLSPSSNLQIPKTIKKQEDIAMIKASHFQTDQLVDQVANLKLAKKSG